MEEQIFDIKVYTPEDKLTWNVFVENSKNGNFLFNRDYMDYHSDRFVDHSLMIYRKGKLFALLPANIKDDVLYSHQGLTFGGLLLNNKSTVIDVLGVMEYMNQYIKARGIKKVVYKVIPIIFQNIPAQEDLYALFRLTNARLIGRNISSTIYQNNKVKFIESRKSGIRKAQREGIIIKLSDDYSAFWKILDDNLANKYGAKPVHSLEEIILLKSRFPKNIVLYLAYHDEKAVGGTVLYICGNVVHTQYISASEEGKALGALDLMFDYLINQEYVKYPIFDFGTSNEQMGHVLNDALIFQKEGFGGRAISCDIYEYDLV